MRLGLGLAAGGSMVVVAAMGLLHGLGPALLTAGLILIVSGALVLVFGQGL